MTTRRGTPRAQGADVFNENPGRPLWLAAERARAEQFGGMDLTRFVAKLGIGRTTYARLRTQRERPIMRTVQKIASGIGMPIEEAMRLAGYGQPPTPAQHATARPGVISIAARVGTVHVEARDFDPTVAGRQIDALRAAGRDTGRTLGDMLTATGLAEPEELRLTDEGAGKPDE